ncbi:MAG: methionine ABC transporter ATP-binding protein, partial [Actinobacteria bacterium]|nr:methionine ABC transporter ATP-binding protein [Actinomycetota bacterium]
VTHDLGVVADVADTLAVMYGGTVVELGSTQQVMGSPSHPYTAALLGARPSNRAPGERLVTIPGVPAVPGQWPTGCRFAPRCTYARDVCRTAQPALLPLADDRSSACHGWPAPNEEAHAHV